MFDTSSYTEGWPSDDDLHSTFAECERITDSDPEDVSEPPTKCLVHLTTEMPGMLTRPQPHEAETEATTHEAEATTHEAEAEAEAEAKIHLEFLIIII